MRWLLWCFCLLAESYETINHYHCTTLLRSEIPSRMRANLLTAAASNNGDHARNLSLRTLVVTFTRSHVNIGRATTLQALLLLLARATHMMVLFFTHIPFVVNHTINATPPERLQQHPLLFATNHTDRTFFVWRLNSVQPSHPRHSTILSRSEIPSGMRAKLRTVAAESCWNRLRICGHLC